MRNDNSILNTTKLITGKDGRVFVTTPNTNKVFLAEVDTFSVPMNITNVPCQPVGSLLEFGVTASYSVSLSLTEMVIRDDTMFDILIEDLQLGYTPSFDFDGVLYRRDGQEQRMVFRRCVPDGQIDLMNLTPGEIIKRQWNFKVNSIPQLLSQFAYED